MNTQSTPTLLSVLLAGTALVSLVACSEKPKSTISTNETRQTQSAVNAYETTGSKALKLQAEKAFIELDQEIKELEARVATTTGAAQSEAQGKLEELKKRNAELRGDFNEASSTPSSRTSRKACAEEHAFSNRLHSPGPRQRITFRFPLRHLSGTGRLWRLRGRRGGLRGSCRRLGRGRVCRRLCRPPRGRFL